MLKKNENSNKYYLLKITSILNLLIFLSLFLIIAIIKAKNLNNIFNINPVNNWWQIYSLKIYLILLLLFILINASLWLAITFKNNWILKIKENLFLSFLLVFLTINFYGCYFIIKNIYNKNDNFNKKNFWNKFKTMLGIKHWLTIDYILIAFFCALTITFTYIEENLLPRMPFGGGIAIKYIPLFIISFTTSFFAGWLTGFISALMSLLFIPLSNIISPWSFALDYFLPMTTPAIIAFLPFKPDNNKSIFTYINYFLHCFLVFLIIYFWQVLSGYFLWTTAFPDSVWNGYNAILYSLVYNFIHIFIFTYPISQTIIPILYRSLGSYYFNLYH